MVELGKLTDCCLDETHDSPDALEGVTDGFGRRFTLDLVVAGPQGSGVVRSAWIARTGEDFPRLTSCYLL